MVSKMLGLKRGTVQVVPYDLRWPILYSAEVNRLRETLGERIGRAEHVGSTAIPGVDAKPIIDLVVAVSDIEAGAALVPELVLLGYEHRPEDSSSERIFLACGPRACRTHHLSLTTENSPFWVEKMLFRDYLRANPAVALEYCNLKRQLAARFSEDRRAYTAAKLPFVQQVLLLAKGDA